MTDTAMDEPIYCYTWANNAKRALLKNRLCRVLCRGTRNSAMVEFLDTGQQEVISRNAIRRVNPKLNATTTPD